MKDLSRCLCGKLFRVYSHYSGDQFRCPSCREAIEREFEEQERKSEENKDLAERITRLMHEQMTGLRPSRRDRMDPDLCGIPTYRL